MNLPPNSTYRITKLTIEKVAVEHFVLIDGERPLIQHKTQFEKQADVSTNFKWFNTMNTTKKNSSNIQTNEQYKFTNDGTTLIISSSVAFSLELDYRLSSIPSKSGMYQKYQFNISEKFI